MVDVVACDITAMVQHIATSAEFCLVQSTHSSLHGAGDGITWHIETATPVHGPTFNTQGLHAVLYHHQHDHDSSCQQPNPAFFVMLMAAVQADTACNGKLTGNESNSMQQELFNKPAITQFGAVVVMPQHGQRGACSNPSTAHNFANTCPI
jgi:hypothetical protein